MLFPRHFQFDEPRNPVLQPPMNMVSYPSGSLVAANCLATRENHLCVCVCVFLISLWWYVVVLVHVCMHACVCACVLWLCSGLQVGASICDEEVSSRLGPHGAVQAAAPWSIIYYRTSPLHFSPPLSFSSCSAPYTPTSSSSSSAV